MNFEAVLGIIIVSYLRKTLKKAGFDPRLDKLLVIAMAASIALLVVGTTVPYGKNIAAWFTHALLLALIYFSLITPAFRAAKSVLYAVLPLIVIGLVEDIVKAVNYGFYKDYDDYFQTAQLFAFIWMFAMWFITKRQRKALETERLKALEKEKEYRITESLKAELEVQVAERTVALTQQKDELQQTITELKSTQAQLIQSEKMASLGELTAGIAHEIQNPLNFVNNFSEVNTELIAEMKEALEKGDLEEVKAIAGDIAENEKKINHHGKRADAIVKGMLQHSRSSNGVKEPTDINALADEYLRLAYHGLRAKDKSFNASMKTDFDDSLSAGETGIGTINIVSQDIGRVILNLITNAFYTVAEKKKQVGAGYEPTVTVITKKMASTVAITVKDNGNGIPQTVLEKIFQPFFTTKPTGQGTGLGLSLSYDIVKAHGGELNVETKEGEGTSFIIHLPV